MDQLSGESNIMGQENRPEVPHQSLAKKPYVPPILTEYGSIAKLTHGAGGSMTEGVAMMPGS